MSFKVVTILGIVVMVAGNLALLALAQETATEEPSTANPSTNPTSTPSQGTTSQGTTSQGTTVDWGQCKEGSDEMQPPQCPPEDDPSGSDYFPFPYDCTQYFQCSNGLARCFKCATGTVWDQQGKVCNHESEVGCVIITTPAATNIRA